MIPDELVRDLSRTGQPAPAPTQLHPRRSRRAATWGGALLLAVVLVSAVHGTGVSPAALFAGRAGGLRLISGFLHPDLSAAFLADVGTALLDTAQIAITGLFLAAAIGLPTAVLLAGNVAAPRLLRLASRVGAAVLRGIPDLLWALLFVATIGPGPAAGTLAVAVHGAGLLAKLGAEQLEAVDPAPVEALRLAGAGRPATAMFAILPQARAGLASLLLYQAECNIRTSTVLGFVGAGGVGQELAVSLKLFRYDELSTLVLAVLAAMFAVDLLSRAVRHSLGAAT
jgi:phosphonate transport system permease protein